MALRKKRCLFLILIFVMAVSFSAFAQELLSVTAAPLTPGSPAVLRFHWQLPQPVTTRWQMAILLPREFDSRQIILAASATLNGGLAVETRGDTVRIMRLGIGDRWTRTAPVDIAIATVGLPQDIGKTYSFTFIMQDSAQTRRFDAQMPLSAYSDR